eukprot:scaffold11903_cov141-Skeletonema_marinoi.AAC.2
MEASCLQVEVVRHHEDFATGAVGGICNVVDVTDSSQGFDICGMLMGAEWILEEEDGTYVA